MSTDPIRIDDIESGKLYRAYTSASSSPYYIVKDEFSGKIQVSCPRDALTRVVHRSEFRSIELVEIYQDEELGNILGIPEVVDDPNVDRGDSSGSDAESDYPDDPVGDPVSMMKEDLMNHHSKESLAHTLAAILVTLDANNISPENL